MRWDVAPNRRATWSRAPGPCPYQVNSPPNHIPATGVWETSRRAGMYRRRSSSRRSRGPRRRTRVHDGQGRRLPAQRRRDDVEQRHVQSGRRSHPDQQAHGVAGDRVARPPEMEGAVLQQPREQVGRAAASRAVADRVGREKIQESGHDVAFGGEPLVRKYTSSRAAAPVAGDWGPAFPLPPRARLADPSPFFGVFSRIRVHLAAVFSIKVE